MPLAFLPDTKDVGVSCITINELHSKENVEFFKEKIISWFMLAYNVSREKAIEELKNDALGEIEEADDNFIYQMSTALFDLGDKYDDLERWTGATRNYFPKEYVDILEGYILGCHDT